MRSKDIVLDILVEVNAITEAGKARLETYKGWLSRHDYIYAPHFYVRRYSKYSKRWALENRETGLIIHLDSRDFEKVRT